MVALKAAIGSAPDNPVYSTAEIFACDERIAGKGGPLADGVRRAIVRRQARSGRI
jgi:hypothetical protein